MYAHVHVPTMYLKYAPYDWLKYWGMAILGRRREVALVFLQRFYTKQVQYKGIVYTRIIHMWLGGI